MNKQNIPQSFMHTSAMTPEGKENPHGMLKAMREQCPVMRDEIMGTWVLFEHEPAKQLLNDRDTVRHPEKAEEGSITRRFLGTQDDTGEESGSILFMDDPDHQRIRQPFMRAFYPRIDKMEAEIGMLIQQVIDQAPADEPFDLVEHIALPIPILVISRILGVDESRYEEFREWSEAAILGLKPFRSAEEDAAMNAGRDALFAYLEDLMIQRRAEPKDDLVTDLVQLQAEGADLSDADLRNNILGLLVGGNLTTTDLIANGLWLLLTHPEEMQKLRDDAGLAPQAVEEVLRYEGPVSVSSRILEKDREVAGCPMKESQVVFFSLHAANRDPAVYEDPDVFDIAKRRKRHIGFGGGAHICIGAPLARLEGREVFLRVLAKYPDLALADDSITWRDLPFFRGVEKLMVQP